jgi:hypothetical protein
VACNLVYADRYLDAILVMAVLIGRKLMFDVPTIAEQHSQVHRLSAYERETLLTQQSAKCALSERGRVEIY